MFKVLGVIPIPNNEEKILFEFEGEITTHDRHKKRLQFRRSLGLTE